jgi:hypothetical protein
MKAPHQKFHGAAESRKAIRSGSVRIEKVAAALLAALLAAVPPAVLGQMTNGVYLAGSSPYGRTYAQWSAAWWQWNFSLPTTNSPIQDTAALSTGQTGTVWFVGGTFGGSGDHIRVRSASVPENTALYVGIMESWADNADCPVPDNYTTAQLRALAANAQNSALAMSCTIDGNNTVDLNSPDYRVQSPVFTYTVPGVHNYLYDLFGATCYYKTSGNYTISGAVADGVYLMIAPLTPGLHALHFSGSVPTGFIVPPYFYVQDITYNLTVVPTPALTVARQGNNLVFSWPQAAPWFVLESSGSLSEPNWAIFHASVQTVGEQLQVTVPAPSGNQFFRLRRI